MKRKKSNGALERNEISWKKRRKRILRKLGMMSADEGAVGAGPAGNDDTEDADGIERE